MSALTLTAGAKPIFISQNRFNRHADDQNDLILSSQTGLRYRLYDMDPNSYWSSSGSSDAIQESINAGLWDSGVQGLYDIDFIAITGHNLKNFTIELSANNGTTWPNSYAYTGQTTSYTLRSLSSSVQANRMRLLMDTTQTANAEKQVGVIILGLASFQSPVALSLYKRKPPRVKTKTAHMYDGSIRRSYIYRSDASVGFFGCSCGFHSLTDSQLTNFRTAILTQNPFIFAPEPGDRPSEIYQGQAVPGTYTENYLNLSKSGDNVVSFDFEETGGA